MANRHEKVAFFDLNTHPFGSDISDPDLKAAFARRVTGSLPRVRTSLRRSKS